jgi:hypothetical protein
MPSTCAPRALRPRSNGQRLALLLLTMCASVATAQADYGFDFAYAPRGYAYDPFGTLGGSSAALGGRHVQLPSGEIVVSGRARLATDPVAPYWNIGLVRYRRFSGRVGWEGPPGPYFWQDRDYVVYPNLQNGGTGYTRIESIDDIAWAEGKFYVLVTRLFSMAPVDRDVAVVVFNEDGTLHQNLDVVAANVDEYGIALDVKVTQLLAKPVAVTVLAQRNAPGPRMVVAKYNLGSNGFLAADGGFNGGVPLQLPITSNCEGSGACNVVAGDLARPQRLNGDAMPIYAVGSVQRAGTDWDYMVARIGANGVLDTAFGVGGVRYIPFDEPASDRGDFAWATHIESSTFGSEDRIYVAGNVNRSCKGGIGVVALGANGLDLGGFGANGRVVYGGSTETGAVCNQDTTHYATQLVQQGSELALAGVAVGMDPAGASFSDGLLLRIDAGNGSLRNLSTLPALDPDSGARVGRVGLWGISAYGNGQYMVSGEISSPDVSAYVTARLQPADRIYADAFDVQVPQR